MVRQRGALQHRLDAVMTTPTLTPSKLNRALLALLLAAAATIASAQESRQPAQHGEQRASEPGQGEQRQANARESVLRLLPADSVTEHAVAIPGGTLCASTMTFPNTPRRTARFRCCCAARRAAKPSRATCFICTAGCWSAPPS